MLHTGSPGLAARPKPGASLRDFLCQAARPPEEQTANVAAFLRQGRGAEKKLAADEGGWLRSGSEWTDACHPVADSGQASEQCRCGTYGHPGAGKLVPSPPEASRGPGSADLTLAGASAKPQACASRSAPSPLRSEQDEGESDERRVSAPVFPNGGLTVRLSVHSWPQALLPARGLTHLVL